MSFLFISLPWLWNESLWSLNKSENSGMYKLLKVRYFVLEDVSKIFYCHQLDDLKPKFLNPKVFIDLSRSIPTQFSPFCTWIFYTYKCEYFMRIYQYFSCLHSLHECSATHNHYLPLPPRIKFFLRRERVLMWFIVWQSQRVFS